MDCDLRVCCSGGKRTTTRTEKVLIMRELLKTATSWMTSVKVSGRCTPLWCTYTFIVFLLTCKCAKMWGVLRTSWLPLYSPLKNLLKLRPEAIFKSEILFLPKLSWSFYFSSSFHFYSLFLIFRNFFLVFIHFFLVFIPFSCLYLKVKFLLFFFNLIFCCLFFVINLLELNFCLKN